MSVGQYQTRLLGDFTRTSIFPTLAERIQEAFLSCPRHAFVHRYRFWNEAEWSELTPNEYHFDRVYRDEPLVISGDGEFAYQSSNSQPSYILGLLENLDIRPGHRVLEVGSGSGWLTAIISRLVGASGVVVGIETIGQLAHQSRIDLMELGCDNVRIIEGDGRLGCASEAPFDRVIFTAGLYSIPEVFFNHVKMGGRLLAPFRMAGHGDVIAVLERVADGFCSIRTFDGYFVPVVGAPTPLDIVRLYAEPRWSLLMREMHTHQPFWWGQSNQMLGTIQKSAAFRTFLSLTKGGSVRAVDLGSGDGALLRRNFAFGFIDFERASAGLVIDGGLAGYGAPDSFNNLWACLDEWMKYGMPTGANFQLAVTLEGRPSSPNKNEWIDERDGTTFVWTLLH